jgi:cytochrome b
MSAAATTRVLVWPWWQRLLHWCLAACVGTALATYHGGAVHESAGYAALAIATLRIALGVFGPAGARFGSFVRGWTATLQYARDVTHYTERRYLNHNPLGAWMIVALLTLSALGAGSGWLYTTDRYWGVDWVIVLHAALTWPIVGLVALHICGAIAAGMRHRENLFASMLHGYKDAGKDTPVANDKR